MSQLSPLAHVGTLGADISCSVAAPLFHTAFSGVTALQQGWQTPAGDQIGAVRAPDSGSICYCGPVEPNERDDIVDPRYGARSTYANFKIFVTWYKPYVSGSQVAGVLAFGCYTIVDTNVAYIRLIEFYLDSGEPLSFHLSWLRRCIAARGQNRFLNTRKLKYLNYYS